MQYLNQEIENELKNQGAELIRFVNIAFRRKAKQATPDRHCFCAPANRRIC